MQAREPEFHPPEYTGRAKHGVTCLESQHWGVGHRRITIDMKIPEAPRSANLVKLVSLQPMRDPVSKNQEARTRGQTPKVDH